MGADIAIYIILTAGSTITGIIYALKHIKRCKSFACSCDQEVVTDFKDSEDIHEQGKISPLSSTAISKKKVRPIAFFSSSPKKSPKASQSNDIK